MKELDWIEHNKPYLLETLVGWVNINSGSYHLKGLANQLVALKAAFELLKPDKLNTIALSPIERVNDQGLLFNVPLGEALHLVKRAKAPVKILLGGHMDTVFGSDSPFQKAEYCGSEKIIGPGCLDMKGGLVVMLAALLVLENSPYKDRIGWEILITPDEEIGSVASYPLWIDAAKRAHIGLIFEPAFADGSIVSSRAGSANLSIIAEGKSAHAGRDFEKGKSAIYALCALICDLAKLNPPPSKEGIQDSTLNVGKIHGGTAANIIPQHAICHVNYRSNHLASMEEMKQSIYRLVKQHQQATGVKFSIVEQSYRSPKSIEAPTEILFNTFQECGRALHMQLNWRPSRGVCDGNILSEAGLPNLDTLGVVGGNMHTYDEYMLVDSLIERAKLSALFLINLATNQITLPFL